MSLHGDVFIIYQHNTANCINLYLLDPGKNITILKIKPISNERLFSNSH